MREFEHQNFYTYAGTPGCPDAAYIEVVALPGDAWAYRHNTPEIIADWQVTYCPADIVNEWQERYDDLTTYRDGPA
jgi:hypothetical protein